MIRIHSLLFICAAPAFLIGCADVKQEIGLGRQSPDEFAVVTRAPLSIPPSFDLRPPNPGAVRPQEGTTRKSAQDIIFSETTASNQGNKSDAEALLLQKSGAAEANPHIRELVDRDLGQVDVKDPYVGRRLLFWKDDPNAAADVINPIEEAKRLQESPDITEAPSEEVSQ